MAGATVLRTNGLLPAVITDTFSNILAYLLVAVQTFLFLAGLAEPFMACCTILFIFSMTLDYLTRHDD